MSDFSDESLDELRQHIEDRKRVTLTEGRMLLNRLEDAAIEIARLQESLAQVRNNHSPQDKALSQDQQIPDSLGGLLARAQEIAAENDRASLTNAIYTWCSKWLHVRSKLAELITAEAQVHADIERLEQEAEALSTHLSTLLQHQQQ